MQKDRIQKATSAVIRLKNAFESTKSQINKNIIVLNNFSSQYIKTDPRHILFMEYKQKNE